MTEARTDFKPGDQLKASDLNTIGQMLNAPGLVNRLVDPDAENWIPVHTEDDIPPYSLAIMDVENITVGPRGLGVKKYSAVEDSTDIVLMSGEMSVNKFGLMQQPKRGSIYKLKADVSAVKGTLCGLKRGEWKVFKATSNPIFMCTQSPDANGYGYFIALGGSKGSGNPSIHFTITSTAFTIGLGALGCDHVTAVVDLISCGGAEGVEVGDEVDIYDPQGCFFNATIYELEGAVGKAELMDSTAYKKGLEYVVPCVPDVQLKGCIWVVYDMCCLEEQMYGI